ncbi:MAG: 5'/3'-nucleotidase SurE [Treponema sp.]|nr:5'/3'-nucleotidase SurE [Treponema sp.]
MNILVTNDDGITGEGLLLLAVALRAQGRHRIWVLAPDSDCSGVSHSISFLKAPLCLTPRGVDTWVCSGTPADCVMMAILGGLSIKPDLVVSGINKGANIGTDIIYSGTAAAARQGSLYGLPSIALSLAGEGTFYWEEAVSFVVDHLEELQALWKADTFINVNLPNTPGKPEGMLTTFPSLRMYHDRISIFDVPGGRKYCFINGGSIWTEPETGSDWDAVSRNYVSVSPVFVHPVVSRELCPGAPEYTAVALRSLKKQG